MITRDLMPDIGNGRLVPSGGLSPLGSGAAGASSHNDDQERGIAPGAALANPTHVPALVFLALAFIIWRMTKR